MAPSLHQFLAQFLTEERLARFEDVLAHRTRHLTLVLENVFHAHNASACLRTCDCLGIQDVHIIETRNAFEPNDDIALGSGQWLTTRRFHATSDEDSPTADCIADLRQAGYRILATSPLQNSLPLHEDTATEKTAVIFGAEQLGVSQTAIDQADDLVHIPMYGFTESFNISVSVALVFQQLLNRVREHGDAWQLTETEKQELREKWVRQSLGTKLAPLIRRFEQDLGHDAD